MENKNAVTQEEIVAANEIIRKINTYYYSKMVGQQELGLSLLVSLMCNGHILIESVPGLAKTTAAKVMTEAVNGAFSRIQCTPDLLPSDIIGTQVLNLQTNTFETKIGPVNANFVLLDEINRSSAKTQSAMLEVMQEHQVTIGNDNYSVPKVFMVMATQNPIEQEGTYLLSEAQLDRFIIKEKLVYPSQTEEVEILNRIENHVFDTVTSAVELEDVVYLQDLVKRVYMDDAIKNYIVAIVSATRQPDRFIDKRLASYITLGASTRGAIALMEVSKAIALIFGRNYVTPDDVKRMIYSVLRHRITLNFAAMADGVTEEQIISAILSAIVTP